MYGVTLVGHKTDLIVKPFIYSNVKVVRKVVMLTDNDPEAIKTAKMASDELAKYGVNSNTIQVGDMFNFQRIFFTARRISRNDGNPEWINITAGPGIAIAALITAFNDSNLIYFKENDPGRGVIVINIKEVIPGFKKITELLPVIDYALKKKSFEFDELASQFKPVSKATLSRRLSLLRRAGFIESIGAGRGRKRKRYFVTDLGEYISATELL
jgi:DNA-binding transcriptional ArsR family regulator